MNLTWQHLGITVLLLVPLGLAPAPAYGECGDGVLDFGEACDDGNEDRGDCCAGCRAVNERSVCADATACSLESTCVAGVCTSGGPQCEDDDIPCTQTVCDERFGCVHVPNDDLCDDGIACNGAEVCEVEGGCREADEPLDCSYLDTPCRTGLCSEAAGGCLAAASLDPVCDDDGDGVPADEDRCAATIVGDTEVTLGCGTLDIAREPTLLTDPVEAHWQRGSAALASERELERYVKKLNRRVASLRKVARRLAVGKICSTSRLYDRQNARLQKDASVLMARTQALLNEKRGRNSYTGDATVIGDVAASDGEAVLLTLWTTKLDDMLAASAEAGDAIRNMCEAVEARAEKIDSTIVDIDDRRKLAQLASGATVLIPERKRRSLFAGSFFRGRGHRVSGTDLFIGTRTQGKPPTSIFVGDDPNWADCLNLEIVPFQELPPGIPESEIVQHPLDGYFVDGVLQLEGLMQFAVGADGCVNNAPGGKVYRYALEIIPQTFIEASTGKKNNKKVPLSSELAPGERVFLPGIQNQTTWSFTVKKIRQVCDLLDPTSCQGAGTSGPVTYDAYFLSYGGYCAAEYSETAFSVEDVTMTGATNAPAGVQRGGTFQVTGTSNFLNLQMPDAQFQAEAYLFLLVGTSYPTASTVGVDTPITIFRDSDFFPYYHGESSGLFGRVYALLATGVTKRAGLKWPRIEGTRNGAPARYACSTPDITLDRLHAECWYSPRGKNVDTYYRLPYRTTWNGANRIWYCNHCNRDDPDGATHGGGQTFAFDLDAPEGTDLFASRGGVVELVRDTFPDNQWDCYNDLADCVTACGETPTDKCINDCGNCDMGNYVILQHDDGTYASYFHLTVDSVPSALQAGVRIRRGAKIGQVGTTGNSSGPHVHVDVNDCEPVPDGFQQNMIRCGSPVEMYFESGEDELPNAADGPLDLCYVPTKADSERSANNCNDPVNNRPCGLQ